MGSRKRGDYSKFAGKGEVSKKVGEVQLALDKESARIVVGTAIGAIVASQPTIATLIATYKVARWSYDTYQKAESTYERTADVNESVKTVAKETVKLGIANSDVRRFCRGTDIFYREFYSCRRGSWASQDRYDSLVASYVEVNKRVVVDLFNKETSFQSSLV